MIVGKPYHLGYTVPNSQKIDGRKCNIEEHVPCFINSKALLPMMMNYVFEIFDLLTYLAYT